MVAKAKAPSATKRKPRANEKQAVVATAVIKGTKRKAPNPNKDARSKLEKLRDQAAIARLYMRGWMQKDIAIELNLSEATVSRDLKELMKALEASAMEDLKIAKARELAKINHMEHEAWLAWEQSKQPTRTTEKAAGEGQVARAKIKERQQTGDPRYMQVIQWCIEMRAKILGILAPQKVAATDPTGEESVPLYTVAPAPVDYRQAIAALRPPDDGEGGGE